MIARLSDRSKKIKPSFTLEMTSKAAKSLAIGAAGTLFGGALAGKTEEEVAEITRDTDSLKSYLTQYYTNLNPELRQRPDLVEKFVKDQKNIENKRTMALVCLLYTSPSPRD